MPGTRAAAIALRPLLIVTLVLAAAATAGCIGVTSDGRAQAARDAGAGVVAAIARGDVIEVSSRMKAPVDAARLGELQSIVPSGYGGDPIMYDAAVDEPDASGATRVWVSRNSPKGPIGFRVAIVWDAADSSWRVTSVRRTSGK